LFILNTLEVFKAQITSRISNLFWEELDLIENIRKA